VRKRKCFLCVGMVNILFFVALAIGAGSGDALFSKLDVKPVKGNRTMPHIPLKDLKGQQVDLKALKGRVIFLNFWATWCGPCKEEMPSMQALYHEFKEKGFVFLTISVDYEGLKPVKEFIEKNRYTFPVLIDQKGETLDLFEVNGIPTTFLINKQGKMVGKIIGPRDWKSPEAISLLSQLMRQ
jgi:cytochrome c biogenesis protein CcmG/thiol:disulfide interchange protein DsbE